MQLSKRLTAIASFIPPATRVADIGADHGWLLISLAKKGLLTKGIIGELNFGPYQVAKDNVAKYGYDHLIDVRQGDGLTVLNQNEVDAIVIAGVGGALICHILETGQDKQLGNLILQANNGAHLVRAWLDKNQFQLVDEQLIEEKGIIYELMVAAPGKDPHLYTADIPKKNLLAVGPLLWKAKSPLLKIKLQQDLAYYQQLFIKIPDTAKQLKIKKIINWYQNLLEELS